jgi:hypothetical protein
VQSLNRTQPAPVAESASTEPSLLARGIAD